MALIRKAKKLGNSAGVLLPKKLLGSDVRITVINRPINIKKQTLKIISKDLEEILGVYIVNKDPIEVIAISNNIRKITSSEKIKVTFIPINLIKNDLKKRKDLKQKFKDAETIINNSLLNELRKV